MQESESFSRQTRPAASSTHAPPSHAIPQPCQDLALLLRDYARERPEVAALWCLGIGFVLGWKLKPW